MKPKENYSPIKQSLERGITCGDPWGGIPSVIRWGGSKNNKSAALCAAFLFPFARSSKLASLWK
jgi:hypothetical protein